MSHTCDEFQALLQRARDGSQDAARALYDTYADHVRDAVRRHLDDRVRCLYDSSDLAQEAWAAFFQDALHNQSFDRPENFLAFLSRVARNKVIDANRCQLDTQKHDLHRQCSFDTPEVCPEIDLLARQPQPWEIVMAAEQWAYLLEHAPAAGAPIVDMLRDGYTPHEIAERLHLHPATIRRLVRKLQERLRPREVAPAAP